MHPTKITISLLCQTEVPEIHGFGRLFLRLVNEKQATMGKQQGRSRVEHRSMICQKRSRFDCPSSIEIPRQTKISAGGIRIVLKQDIIIFRGRRKQIEIDLFSNGVRVHMCLGPFIRCKTLNKADTEGVPCSITVSFEQSSSRNSQPSFALRAWP